MEKALIETQRTLIEALKQQADCEKRRADEAEAAFIRMQERYKKLREQSQGNPDEDREIRRREKAAALADKRESDAGAAPKKTPRPPKKCGSCKQTYTAFTCPSIDCKAARETAKREKEEKAAAMARAAASDDLEYGF